MTSPKIIKVLIVEDEPTLRDLFGIRLKEQNYEVSAAANGKEALSLCASEKPDFILLDINLPDILGVDIVEKIKEAKETYGDPKIIVVTGIAYSIKDAEKIWLDEFGVSGFFTKPFDLQELLDKIESLI